MRVLRDLFAARQRYPQNLPLTHIALLSGWEPKSGPVNSMLAGSTPDEFEQLSPLPKQLEINRAQAQSQLVLDRAGQSELSEDGRERLIQRALGILPTEEWARLLEVASCSEFSPGFLTSNPERFVQGITVVEVDMGQATALAYGFLLMAGVRSNDDLQKYGHRIEELFAAAAMSDSVQHQLQTMDKSGLGSLTNEARTRIVHAVRDGLWRLADVRAGQAFLFTQVLDGYLGLRPGGLGDDLGLAVADGIVVAKLGFPVSFLLAGGKVYLEVAVSDGEREYWHAFDRKAAAGVPTGLRLGTADLLVLGYTRLARGYATIKSYAHGVRVARWVLDLDPDSAEAYQTLGQCLLGRERPADAIDVCERALAIDPGLADAYVVQGNAHSLMRRWPEAIERYRKAIRCRAGYAEAHNNLGLALQRNGELEQAVSAYTEATRVRNGDYAEAWYNLGNLYFERAPTLANEPEQQADYGRAIDAYRMAVKHAPGFSGAHYNLGQAYYARKDLPAALAAYQAAVKTNPKHAGAWHNMGIVYRDLGKPELAVEAIEKAVTLNPILLR
ncbi:tetratricopeptide repeat protein [candidate division WOR-3 bacterium]|nr:tetratricopeptide repeat protein [candidate division WOR-3 bacterium]